MKQRCPPSPEQLECLVKYFGCQCVVTGNEVYEWHHLDDDPANTVIENLVPINRDLNLKLRDMEVAKCKSRLCVPDALLVPHSLKTASELCAQRWEFGRAYGCARLGCFVASKYGVGADISIQIACQAIYYARHRLNFRFIADTFRRSILPILERENLLQQHTRFALVREVAGIYAEHGRSKEALELYEGQKISAAASERELAAIFRREATTSAAVYGLDRNANARFEEARQLSRDDINHNASVSNSLAWLYISENEYSKALEVLEPLVKPLRKAIFRPGHKVTPIAMTAWNAAEIFHNYAIALSGAKPSKYKERRRRALVEAAELFKISGSAFYEISEGFTIAAGKAIGTELSYSSSDKLSDELKELMVGVILALKNIKF